MNLERYAEFEGLLVEQADDGIIRLAMRLDRIEHAHGDLGRAMLAVSTDPDVRVVIAGGDPNHYAGDSLGYMERVAEEWDLRLRVMQEASDIVYNTINCQKPVISLFPGPVVALALVADISIASRDAVILDAHTTYGAVAGDHAVMSWPLLCGMAKAKYYLLTGEPLTGAEAERIGLVSLCVDSDDLDSVALEVAHKLAAGSQRAIRWTKHALNNWYRAAGPAFDASLAMEFITFAGPDVREGIDAMRTGRAPQFHESF